MSLWNSLSPAGQILAACIATFAIGLIAAMALVTAGIYVLVRLDRHHPRTEWEQIESTVTEGRADFTPAPTDEWPPEAIARLLAAVNDPHALDGALSEYEERAWAEMERRLR